jgi:hypothetical protein
MLAAKYNGWIAPLAVAYLAQSPAVYEEIPHRPDAASVLGRLCETLSLRIGNGLATPAEAHVHFWPISAYRHRQHGVQAV